MEKQKIIEIVSGNSIYHTMKNSNLNNNEIIKFNTVFSIANLSSIDEFKLTFPKGLFYETIIYEFKTEINRLNDLVKNKNKIRVWCSYQEPDSYILLTFIANHFKNQNLDLYVTYSSDYNPNIQSPSMLKETELEELSLKEHKLSNDDISVLSNIWNEIKDNNSNLRIMENNKVKSISYNYFYNIILDKLKTLGKTKQINLVIELLKNYHLVDLIFVYLINNLIQDNKIEIIEKSKDNHEYNNIISIKEN